ncbi:MAG: hypothetical protein ACP5MG_05770 [Verrucomicrobiia bacterium]|jgi:hypothetical protein
MNRELLLKKLLNAAKLHRPADTVPYAFEKRIMARIESAQVYETTLFWAQNLWRAAKPCIAIMIIVCLWALFAHNQVAIDNPQEAFETAVLAGLNQIGTSW